jgi:hypothetical protein
MRLVKLSPADADFTNEEALHNYFIGNGKLRAGIPPGVFAFKKGHIKENELAPGETILFSYLSKLRYVARAKTGRTVNEYPHRSPKEYHYCFLVDLGSMRKADVSLQEVERRLRAQAGLQKSLQGQGWTHIPDSKQAETVIAALLDAPIADDTPDWIPERKECVVRRIIRDTETSRHVKRLYENTCQVCGERLEIAPGEYYAEAHHLQPLGGNHKGSDVKDNILCLCPNHHALFDYFAISLDTAKLLLNKHRLRKSSVDYHNAMARNSSSAKNSSQECEISVDRETR